MSGGTISYTVTRGDEAFELHVEYEVAAYDPGSSWGLPEDSEPPSGGEIETLAVSLDGKQFDLTDDETSALERHIYETHDYSDDGGYTEDDWLAERDL